MNIIDILKVVLLGIVEGITEWLPISSTGHMILLDELIHLNITEEFKEMFLVVIQLGAILAVVVLYFQKLNPFAKRKSPRQVKQTFSLWYKVLIGCIPAGIIGVLFDDEIDKLFYNPLTVSITLILYGILFIVIENYNKRREPEITKLSEISYKVALFIGVFQILALIPGTSRSGATIIGGILLGTSRAIAAEFTFFLAIPVMFGASGIKLLKYFLEVGWHMNGIEIGILVLGMTTAFLVSIFAIKFLMGYIRKNDFKIFGWYRIVLGILVIAYFFIFEKFF